jgi:thiol-disulfide isomerase/thioredoxin
MKVRRIVSTMGLALALGGAAAIVAQHDAVGEAGSTRPWLGVELDQARGDARGVRVKHTIRSSPAWKAGLRDGDLILRVGDVAVSRPDDVIREVGSHAAGTSLRLTVQRGGSDVQLSALLAPLPDNDEMLRLDKVGAPAPTWKGIAAVSGPLPSGLGELKGRVVVLDFWATWCMACRMSVPKLAAWQAKFGAQGLSVIGITDDPVPDAVQAANSFGMRYAAIGTDESSMTQRAFGVRALPTVFVIDKRGVIRDVSVGFDPQKEAEMESLLTRLLAEPAP